MLESPTKSPLQEKRLYLLIKYNRFVNRRAYTYTSQTKINMPKIRYVNNKEI